VLHLTCETAHMQAHTCSGPRVRLHIRENMCVCVCVLCGCKTCETCETAYQREGVCVCVCVLCGCKTCETRVRQHIRKSASDHSYAVSQVQSHTSAL